ncbi:hypothetical protein MPL3356_350029 [Mesorhizobium plurifarium]|uniref:Uncharacterized protein n=1 Tax=Mesorhizobium plurifarium TaxID=69974 RepID=A0A090DW99_MESPL|nr:hypothetical protein MPL3356_350029 [Mesorhizobium plurifarium]
MRADVAIDGDVGSLSTGLVMVKKVADRAGNWAATKSAMLWGAEIISEGSSEGRGRLHPEIGQEEQSRRRHPLGDGWRRICT